MLLAFDIGNTQIMVALYEGDHRVFHWRFPTNKELEVGEAKALMAALLEADGFVGAAQDGVIASVVPRLTQVWAQAAGELLGSEPLVVDASLDLGLAIDYDNPAEIGADRLADAVAVIAKLGAPAAVVDFGTATNIEFIDQQGTFIGGIIAPGLDTSAGALFSIASKLSEVPLEVPQDVIGRSTATAVQSGLTYGEIERIDGLLDRAFEQLGYTMPVIATGGLAPRVLTLSRHVQDYDEFLTVDGLRLIYQRLRG